MEKQTATVKLEQDFFIEMGEIWGVFGEGAATTGANHPVKPLEKFAKQICFCFFCRDFMNTAKRASGG